MYVNTYKLDNINIIYSLQSKSNINVPNDT